MARKQTSEKEIVVSGSGSAPARSRRKPAPAASRPRRTSAQEPAPASLPAETAALPEETISDSAAAVASYQPSHKDIATLAYSYWEARGCQGGSPEQDWLRAEQELIAGRNVVS